MFKRAHIRLHTRYWAVSLRKSTTSSGLQDLRLRLLHRMHMHMRGFCYGMTNFDTLHPRVRHDVLDRKTQFRVWLKHLPD